MLMKIHRFRQVPENCRLIFILGKKLTVMKLIYSILLCLPLILNAEIILVGPQGDFLNLSEAAPFALPGDTLLLESHVFSNGTQFIENMNGAEGQYITILGSEGTVFRGGTEAIHLINCNYVIIENITVEQQTGNGINIDDGADYSTPTHHIIIRNCLFQDMAANGNNDLLKLSGLDDFIIEGCSFLNGASGGSGLDMVGCHLGLIRYCVFDNAGVSGIQAKGGTDRIKIFANTFMNISQRGINIGGSTGLQFFRPPLPDPIVDAYESSLISVCSNVFYRNWASVAFVGTVNSEVVNNTIIQPLNWVFRILQETTVEGFLTCANNRFINNIVYMEVDLTEVNIGPNTDAESFILAHNLWYNASSDNWTPNLPVEDVNQIIANPLLLNPDDADYLLSEDSPAIGSGVSLDGVFLDIESKLFLDPPSIGAYEGGVISSIEEFSGTNLKVFPNPANNLINIDSDLYLGRNYSLVNIKGELISNAILESKSINVSHLENGHYFLIWNDNLAPISFMVKRN